MNEPAPISPSSIGCNIEIWLVFYDQILDPALLARYRELLTDEERAQEGRFYFPDDRKRYVVTRALVRTVLSRYVAIPPAAWRFAPDRYGRPAIINMTPTDCDLRFNLSHTRGLIALAIAHRRALGVDVENVRARPVSIEIAERFLAAEEMAELSNLRQEQQRDRFLEYWTFKESYVKARGLGLSIPLQQFSFHYPHERAVRLAVHPSLGDDASRWRFWQFRPSSEHLFALCAERHRDAASLKVRRSVPLVTEEIVRPQLLKTSES